VRTESAPRTQVLHEKLEKLSCIPNTPFLKQAIAKTIFAELCNLGIDSQFGISNNIEHRVATNEYGIYVRLKNGQTSKRVIIDSHLDHPAMALDGKGKGTILGSIDINAIRRTLINSEVPVRIYDPEGNQTFSSSIVKINDKREVFIKDKKQAAPNSHAIWDLPVFQETDTHLKGLSLDNFVGVTLSLDLISRILSLDSDSPFDVEFMFPFVEEVRQICSTGISISGGSPLGRIDENCLLVVLESASVDIKQEYKDICKEIGVNLPNYSNGPIIRVNDNQLVYSLRHNGQNQAENLLLFAADGVKHKFQHTVLQGVCNSSAYALLSGTPHIASITIPTKHKHNVSVDGLIELEEISKSDLVAASNLLESLVQIAGTIEGNVPSRKDGISPVLKKFIKPGTSLQAAMRKEMKATLNYNTERLRAGKYYPETFTEKLNINKDRIKSRFD